MDIQPQTTKPISDDQELAKVLAGITQTPTNTFSTNNMSAPAPTYTPPMTLPTAPINPIIPEVPVASQNTPTLNNIQPETPSNNLEEIKKQALVELRPLVEKLTLEPDEKFNIYLLLLRSTDDKTLIIPAHKAAKEISDETKRAQALLDIIKEIDYLSNPNPVV